MEFSDGFTGLDNVEPAVVVVVVADPRFFKLTARLAVDDADVWTVEDDDGDDASDASETDDVGILSTPRGVA